MTHSSPFNGSSLTIERPRRASRKQQRPCHPVSSILLPSSETTNPCPNPCLSGPILGLVSLVMIAGALLLTLLILIGGGVNKNPTNQFYFLQAATTGIPGAAATTRWTFWNACSVTNGRNACPKVHPAYPFDPPRNFGTTTGVPPQFVG